MCDMAGGGIDVGMGNGRRAQTSRHIQVESVRYIKNEDLEE